MKKQLLENKSSNAGNINNILNAYDIFLKRNSAPLVPFNDCTRFDRVHNNFPDVDDSDLDVTKDAFGSSMAGISTSIMIPKLDLTLDAGRTVIGLPTTSRYFLSHFDPDHVDGLPAIACSSIKRKKPISIFIPRKRNEKIMSVMNDLRKKNPSINMNVIEVGNEDRVQVDQDTIYEFFKTSHVDESLGISVLKKRGNDWIRMLAYSGDTKLDEKTRRDPKLRDAMNVIMESTTSGLLRKIKNIEWKRDLIGHSSLDNVASFVSDSNNIKNVLMTHFLPTFCVDITMDTKDEFHELNSNRGIKVGYLPSCSKILNNPLERSHPRKVF